MRRLFYLPGILSLGIFAASPVGAVDFNWNVEGPADWAVGTNWDPEGPPSGGGGNHAFVNNGGTAEISEDIEDFQDIFVGVGTTDEEPNVGTVNQTGGNTFQGTGSWMFVGQDGGNGTYNLSGGTQGKERLYVGRGGDGVGTLNVSGTGVVGGDLLITGVDGGVATVNFSEQGSAQTTGTVEFHNAQVTVTDDALVKSGNEVWVGQGEGNSSTLDQDSGTIEADTWMVVGRGSSTGVANLSGSAVMRKNLVDDGDDEVVSNSEGSFIVVGAQGTGGSGTLNIQDDATVWSDTGMVLNETEGQAGIVNQSGGTVTLHDFAPADFQPQLGQSLNIDPNGHGQGEYHLSGGTLNAETVFVGGGVFDMSGGTFNAESIELNEGGVFNKTDGTLNFTSFEMNGGTLSADVLAGDLTQDGGTVSPGSSPGTMTIDGDYSLNSGDLFIELDGLIAGDEYDQLIVTGDVSLAGDLTLDLGFTPDIGDAFTIIDNRGPNAVNGAFSQGSSISAGGLTFGINYAGGDGNDVVLTAVPEPASVVLLGAMGLAGAAVWRRRR